MIPVAPEPEPLSLVALTPNEIGPAQVQLKGWCERKIDALKVEQADLQTHLDLAKKNKWNRTGLTNALTRTSRRIVYYEKMHDAVSAGYLMVPNMPISILAVRVNNAAPRSRSSEHYWTRSFPTPTQMLPSGDGRYVDETVGTIDASYTEKQPDGSTKKFIHIVSNDVYDDPDFPFEAVKPHVLVATQRAMALKIFDQIGVVQNGRARKGDPIMVGRLLDPRGNGRCATFFIAWWLNTADL